MKTEMHLLAFTLSPITPRCVGIPFTPGASTGFTVSLHWDDIGFEVILSSMCICDCLEVGQMVLSYRTFGLSRVLMEDVL